MLTFSLIANAVLLALLIAGHVEHGLSLDRLRAYHHGREEGLLNRIQAPEAAVAATLPDVPGKQYVDIHSDEEFWAAMDELKADS